MKTKNQWNRRDFLQTAGVATLSADILGKPKYVEDEGVSVPDSHGEDGREHP